MVVDLYLVCNCLATVCIRVAISWQNPMYIVYIIPDLKTGLHDKRKNLKLMHALHSLVMKSCALVGVCIRWGAHGQFDAK